MRQWLVNDPGVGPVVGNRVYEMDLPQSPTFPAMTFEVVSDPEIWRHHGSALVQLTMYAFSSDETRTMRNLVRAAAANWGGATATCRIEEIFAGAPTRSSHDPDTGWYRREQDLRILHIKRG